MGNTGAYAAEFINGFTQSYNLVQERKKNQELIRQKQAALDEKKAQQKFSNFNTRLAASWDVYNNTDVGSTMNRNAFNSIAKMHNDPEIAEMLGLNPMEGVTKEDFTPEDIKKVSDAYEKAQKLYKKNGNLSMSKKIYGDAINSSTAGVYAKKVQQKQYDEQIESFAEKTDKGQGTLKEQAARSVAKILSGDLSEEEVAQEEQNLLFLRKQAGLGAAATRVDETTQMERGHIKHNIDNPGKEITLGEYKRTYWDTVKKGTTITTPEGLVIEQDGGAGTNSQEIKWREKVGEMKATHATVVELADKLGGLAEDGDIIGLVGSMQGLVDTTIEQFGAAARVFTESGEPIDLNEIISDERYDNLFKGNARNSAAFKSTAIKLAYMTAKSNDKTGRVSDSDLKAAVKQVGANTGSRNQLLGALTSLKEDSKTRLDNTIKYSPYNTDEETETVAPQAKEEVESPPPEILKEGINSSFKGKPGVWTLQNGKVVRVR